MTSRLFNKIFAPYMELLVCMRDEDGNAMPREQRNLAGDMQALYQMVRRPHSGLNAAAAARLPTARRRGRRGLPSSPRSRHRRPRAAAVVRCPHSGLNAAAAAKLPTALHMELKARNELRSSARTSYMFCWYGSISEVLGGNEMCRSKQA